MTELANVMNRIVELNARLRELDEEILKLIRRSWRSRKATKRLEEAEEELARMNRELEELKKEVERLMEPLVEEVRQLHRDFRDLNNEHMRHIHYIEPVYRNIFVRERIIKAPFIIIRSHYLIVDTIEELAALLRKLEEIAGRYGVRILFVVDGRPDHFPFPLLLSKDPYGRVAEEELKRLPYYLGYMYDYYFLIEPK